MLARRRAIQPLDQREGGRRAVISTIRREGRVARIDIAQKTGLSPATVTSITAELIDAGLVEETGRDNSEGRRGRPRVELKIRSAAHLVAGIKISDKTATVAILDFEGDQVGELTKIMPRQQMEPRELAEFVAALLDHATAEAGLAPGAISAVGVGIAGFIDAAEGHVYWSPSLRARNVPLLALLSETLKLPTFLDNDANLVAKAEQWFGHGHNVSNFVVVTIEHGVGMGIVINDEIYRGARGCGAEFGHVKVQLDGALCRCGQRGCLEAYVADYALVREADIASEAIRSVDPEGKIVALYEDAKAGNRAARSIFERAGRMLALGLANVVNIFHPQLIILSGERMQFDYLYGDDVIERMKDSVVQIGAHEPEVRIHKWGELMWAKGGAACAMEGVSELAIAGLAENGE